MENTTMPLLHSVDNMENTTMSLLNSSVWDMLSFNDTDFDNMTTTTQAPAPARTPRSWPGLWWYKNVHVFVDVYNYLAYIIGIPGNIFTIIILARLKPMNSSAIWLLAMAVCDLASLVTRALIFPLVKYKHIQYNDQLCHFYFILGQSSEHCNYLYLLAMTTERLIAVWFPLKMSQWCTPKRAIIGSLTIALLLVGAEFHHVETMHVQKNGKCYYLPQYREFWSYTYIDKIQSAMFRITPVLTVLLFNILIAVRLRKSRAIQKKMSDEQLKEKLKQQRQIDRLLTAATLFFFISVFPDITHRLIKHHLGDPRTSWPAARNWVIMVNTFAALRVGNHAANFYLYIVVATKFRNEFIHLITCGRYGEHNGTKGTLSKMAK